MSETSEVAKQKVLAIHKEAYCRFEASSDGPRAVIAYWRGNYVVRISRGVIFEAADSATGEVARSWAEKAAWQDAASQLPSASAAPSDSQLDAELRAYGIDPDELDRKMLAKIRECKATGHSTPMLDEAERQFENAVSTQKASADQDRWIAVGDGLPLERARVLALFENQGVEISSWFRWETMQEPLWAPGIKAWGKVTHWQTLPTPPVGKEGQR